MELMVSWPMSRIPLPATKLLLRSVYPAPPTTNPRQPGVCGIGSIADASGAAAPAPKARINEKA